MPKLHEIQEKRNNIAVQMRELHEKTDAKAWGDEQRKHWEGMKAEIGELDNIIAKEKELRAIEATVEDTVLDGKATFDTVDVENKVTHDTAFRNLILRGYNGLTVDEKKAVQELRAQSKGEDTKGGYTVPTTFQANIIEKMKAYGGLASVCQILNTSDGRTIEWATANATDEVGVMLGENTAATDEDTTFGTTSIGALMMTSKFIKISNTLLQDSGVNIEDYLAQRIAERIGRGEANMIVNGSGAGTPKQPKGLAKSITHKVEVANKTAFNWKSLNDLLHSIDPAYRSSNSFRFAFNDNTFKALKETVDNQGRPLWLPDVIGHAPATILGKQYVIDQAIANAEAGKEFVYAGDFSKFILRRVNYMTLKRLVERYAEFDQTAFIAFHRFDTLLTDDTAIKGLTCKA